MNGSMAAGPVPGGTGARKHPPRSPSAGKLSNVFVKSDGGPNLGVSKIY